MMKTGGLLIVWSCLFSVAFCQAQKALTVFPVFEQKSPPFETYTAFPTRRCVPCRFDYWQVCRSAHIQCHEDGTATELIWSSSLTCEGRPTRARKVPASEMNAQCMNQESISPLDLDMSRFVPRLLKDHGDVFESETQAENTIQEYKKMLFMSQTYPTVSVVPSQAVDHVWHAHILDTANYTKDCNRMFGQYLHHAPSFGDAPEEKQELLTKYDDMLDLYSKLFGEAPSQVWNVRDKRNLTKTGEPNCCAAFCVKTNCAGCLGCDAVNCGTPIVEPRKTESMKGYVPLPDAPKEEVLEQAKQQTDTKFTISPFKVMNFSWSVIDSQTIQFEQVLTMEAWMGCAIGQPGMPFMSYADFMISFTGYNYTGVQDMYRPFAGNDFPCMDNIVECGGPVGFDDLTYKSYHRENGISTSRWRRVVETNDPKDVPINTQGYTTMLFAYGTSDAFGAHGIRAHASGLIDFFEGTSSWEVYSS